MGSRSPSAVNHSKNGSGAEIFYFCAGIPPETAVGNACGSLGKTILVLLDNKRVLKKRAAKGEKFVVKTVRKRMRGDSKKMDSPHLVWVTKNRH